MADPANQASTKSGELTVKQGGIGFLLVAALLMGVSLLASRGVGATTPGTASAWSVGGIPIEAIAGILAVLGVVLTAVGVVKKI